jgi:amino acid adenylation domain-containing protein
LKTTIFNLETDLMIEIEKQKVHYNPFESGPISKAVPSTEAQREMWASIVMDSEATLCYNEALAISFNGILNTELFNLAFQELLKRHDALSSYFSADGKTFFVNEYQKTNITFIDFSKNLENDLEVLKKNEIQHKFDLVNGPIYRAKLIKLDPNHYSFLLSAHHIICDGWSFAILLNELSDIYNKLISGQSPDLEIAEQFSDFATEEYGHGSNKQDKNYWLNKFSKPLVTNSFPIDFPRPSFRSFNSARYDIAVPSELVRKIKKIGAAQGCSFYSTLMSIFNILVYQISGSEDVVIGMASASQSALGKNNLIGHLVNLLPLRTTMNGDSTFNHFLKSLKSEMLDAFEHQFYSYGPLVKDLKNIKREAGQMPLLNIVFNIDQQAPDQGLNFKNISASYHTIPRDFENFEIFINAVSSGDKLVLECQYNTNLFKLSTIQNWLKSFMDLMEIISTKNTESISTFKLPNLKIPITIKSLEDEKKGPLDLVRNLEVEEKIKKIWTAILLNNSLTVEDNFFSVGGHSLLAIEMATLLQDEFKIPLSIKDIFENPTILLIAQKITGPLNKENKLLPVLENYGAIKGNVSNNQLQIWFTEEMHSDSTTYTLPSSLRLNAKINREVLEKTIHILIERHSALRTVITIENGVPVQKILEKNLPEFKPVLALVKTSEDQIVDVLKNEAKKPFNKEIAPLYKVTLFELSENDFVIFSLIHHSIWDGWSFDIYFEELDLIYSALLKGESPVFVKNPGLSYLDYSIWLEDLVKNNFLNNQIEFWQKKLQGPLPVLELPSDFKRPIAMSHSGAAFRFSLSPILVKSLGEYARETQSSQFNVILTAFKITLARYTNLEDIIVGLPIRGRNNPEIMNTIGYFVNTIALRSQIDLSRSFEENLKIVSSTCVEAFDNQLVPFQIVLNKVKHQRDPSRTPIFQTFFSYQDVAHRSRKINGIPYTHLYIDKASTHTDLDLWIRASIEKIDGGFEYNTDIFSEVMIERFTESFLKLLEELKFNNQRPLRKINSMPKKHLDVITKWNETKVETTNFLPFHKIFEIIARLDSSAIAIESSSEQIQYGDLNKSSNRIANALIEQGVGRGALVGISLSRNSNILTAILGVLKTGAGYVPLDPSFPQERLDYMISSATPKVLLTEDSLVRRFKDFSNMLLVENIVHNPMLDDVVPEIAHSLEDTMYVIYTSGSTGTPKGVQISHGSVINFLLAIKERVGFSKNNKILAVTTLSFDIAVLELFLPLVCGGTVFLATGDEAMDGNSLKNILEQKNINIMQATPSTWRLLLASSWKGNNGIKALCGGEAFPIDLAKKLLPICKEVWNMYGSTETTVWSSCKRLSLDDELITVGTPIANTSLYILDENHLMKPIGVSGELFIGGLGVAKGYLGREDLTKERFIADPFKDGARMYATGDLARFTQNGEVECLGRNDGQVKIRGYRIELGEIEAELQKNSSIKEVSVITREYRAGDIRICAFISTTNCQVLDERMLRDDLGKKLPSYMIPSHFTFMDTIPKTPNGKIDKKSLPEFNSHKVSTTKQLEAFSAHASVTNSMEVLRLIWKDVLGVTDLANGDNFFDMGGNSLLAVELFSKITMKFKVNLPLSALIEAENFEAFSLKIQSLLTPENLNLASRSSSQPMRLIPRVYKSMVAIQTKGDKNPMFCFHGVGGNILNYVTLAPATSYERPLLALQSIGMDGITNLSQSVEEMAASYIKEIKMTQPEGPYLLAGGSMGALIAFELALQLKRNGDMIEKVILLDTFGPNLNLKSYRSNRKESFIKRIKSAALIKLKNLLTKIQSRIFRAINIPVPLPILLIEIERKNYEALWNYIPKEQYNGDLHLVRAKIESTGWYSDPVMGWGNCTTGKINTYEINANHTNFLECPELIKVLKGLI